MRQFSMGLSDWLDAAAATLKRHSWWQTWIIMAIAGTLIALLAKGFVNEQVIEPTSAMGLAAIAMFAVGTFDRSRRPALTPLQCARRIERVYPDLDQRLLTAVTVNAGLSPETSAQPLQSQLWDEIQQHAIQHDYAAIIPTWRRRLVKAVGMAGSLSLIIAMGSLWWRQPSATASASVRSVETPDVVIAPGNTSIRRGENLLVTASLRSDLNRWSDSQWNLILSDDSSNETSSVRRPIVMRRTLDDPTWAGLIQEIDQDLRYRVETEDWVSQSFHIDVFELPRVERIDATLTFPDYVGQEIRTVQDVSRLRVVENTTIHWRVELNKPVQAATIQLESGDVIQMETASDSTRVVTGEMLVSQSDIAEFHLIDSEGRENELPPSVAIKMRSNRTPKIEMLTSGDATASPLQELPVRATINDDFGVQRAGIAFTFEGNDPQELTLLTSSKEPGNQKVTLTHQFDFEALTAKPDQVLSYHLWVEDQDEQGQPRRTRGDLFFIDVRPFEEIFRSGQAPPPSQANSPQLKQLDELLDLQKQIISATWNESREDTSRDETNAIDNTIAESQRELSDQLGALAQRMSDEESQKHIADAQSSMQAAGVTLTSAAQGQAAWEDALPDEQAALSAMLRLRAREFRLVRSKQAGQSQGSRRKQRRLNELELDDEDDRYETQSQASTSAQQAESKEDRQLLSRLRELARRQADVNEELAALAAALQTETDPQRQKELQRQLKRLREQQRDLVRDVDELNDRMESSSQSQSQSSPSSPSSSNETSQQDLQSARESMRQSDDAITQEQPGEALAKGRQAQSQLEQLSDQFEQQTAGYFDSVMQSLGERAEALQQNQAELDQSLERLDETTDGPGLRGSDQSEPNEEMLAKQADAAAELLDDVRDVIEQAEESQPLLAKELYQAFQKANRAQLPESLTQASELLRRGFDAEAANQSRKTSQPISELKSDLENAAKAVLGDRTEGLRQAAEALEQLRQGISAEQTEKPNNGKSGSSPEGNGSQRPSESQRGGSSSTGLKRLTGDSSNAAPNAASAKAATAPVSGDGFRAWSDAMRDVEELVQREDLRSRATQIRQRVREARAEFKRHAQPPQWSTIEDVIVSPLRQLQADVEAEYLRQSQPEAALVPIDRDPVPDDFQDAVRIYYERLGES
ncbi:MAG: hypothetical protein AAF539_12295 [Planctomycetota bacterium]